MNDHANPWISLLTELTLDHSEKEVVKRFTDNIEGLHFLAVVDILKKHDYGNEALELLSWGVSKNPTYAAGKAALGKELYHLGLINEAWDVFKSSQRTLKNNLLAQNLMFYCAVLMGYENTARSLLDHLKISQLINDRSSKLGEVFIIDGISDAQQILLDSFKKRDITPEITSDKDDDALSLTGNSKNSEQDLISMDVINDSGINSFHVVPLNEIFFPSDIDQDKDYSNENSPIDSITLAEIYEKQGYFEKSLGVYRRLLNLTPNNEHLQKMISKLVRKAQAQKENDLTIDANIVNNMEVVEKIDQKINFYNEILRKVQHG